MNEEAIRKNWFEGKVEEKEDEENERKNAAHTAEYKTLCHSERAKESESVREREREMLLVTQPNDTYARIRFVMRR